MSAQKWKAQGIFAMQFVFFNWVAVRDLDLTPEKLHCDQNNNLKEDVIEQLHCCGESACCHEIFWEKMV